MTSSQSTTGRTRRDRRAGSDRSESGSVEARPHARRRRAQVGPEYLTVTESASRGKAARKAVSPASHAKFEPASARSDPVEMLERQARSRVPELVPIRYGRMLVSPFTFYRGAAAIMAEDLASTPQSGLLVQCCGDAHLSNFGVFASPERRLVFDINDFDETLPGPWEWDVKRLAVSMLIAARSNDCKGKEQRRAVLECVAAYRTAMRGFAGIGDVEVWYSRFDIESVLAKYADQFKPRSVKGTKKALAKAQTKDRMSAFAKLTHAVDGEVRIVDESPLIVPIEQLAEGVERERIFDELVRLLGLYRDTLPVERQRLFDRFRLADFARKVVGVGSVGTEAWIALLLGPDGKEPLFLQIKQADASVLEQFAGRQRVRESRTAGGDWAAANAGRKRHLPRLAARRRRACATGLLLQATQRLERLRGDRAARSQVTGGVRKDVRLDTRSRACPERRPGGDRVLPRQR